MKKEKVVDIIVATLCGLVGLTSIVAGVAYAVKADFIVNNDYVMEMCKKMFGGTDGAAAFMLSLGVFVLIVVIGFYLYSSGFLGSKPRQGYEAKANLAQGASRLAAARLAAAAGGIGLDMACS